MNGGKIVSKKIKQAIDALHAATRALVIASEALASEAGMWISAMPVAFENVGGYKWIFFSDEENRMHIQVPPKGKGSPRYKVFLERSGKRVFEPVVDKKHDKIPGGLLRELKAEVNRHREQIEALWLEQIIEMGEVTVDVDQKTRVATIVVYPKDRDKIVRKIDMTKHTNDAESYAPGNYALEKDIPALAFGLQKKPSNRRGFINLIGKIWL